MSSVNEDVSCSALQSGVILPARATLNENGVIFSPPAYIQRYGDICDILKNDSRWAGHINKVVDFGCAELSFFMYLKNVPEINTILEVDFDEELLKRFYSRVEPLFYDHLFPRKNPLAVSVLQGSVCDPDYKLIGCDAVICIELIEHLDPAAFDRLPHNIFGFIRPRLVIITTPNADFNVLFPNLKDGGFRHYDHRFEWTREQFYDWANNIVSRYPDYTVEMLGVAPGPKGTEHLGCCSQMALFINHKYEKAEDVDELLVETNLAEGVNSETETNAPIADFVIGQSIISDAQHISVDERNCDNSMDLVLCDQKSADCQHSRSVSISSSSDGDTILSHGNNGTLVKMKDCSFYGSSCMNEPTLDSGPKLLWDCRIWENSSISRYYKTIAEYVYPQECDTRTREQKILHEAIFKVSAFANYDDDYYDENVDCWRIPLNDLVNHITEFKITTDELRSVLSDAKYEIEDDVLMYKKPQGSSFTGSYGSEENIGAEEVEHYQDQQNWQPKEYLCSWADETEDVKKVLNCEWNSGEQQIVNEPVEPNTFDQNQEEYDLVGMTRDDNVMTLYTGLLGDSTASGTDDRSLSSSPLAQFYGGNRDSTEEQRLSDSGYLKSQDSPQSPVCSDSFSNDLITPDKDLSEMMVQSTILECIPENLNFPTSGSSPKDALKPLESRRRSVGPVTGAESNGKTEFTSCPSMSRPKSLHTCTTSFEIGQHDFKSVDESKMKNTDINYSPGTPVPYSPSQPGIVSPQLNILSPEKNDFQPNQPVHFENVPRHFNLPRVQNYREMRHNDFEMRERLVRPDFLQIQNLEVAVVDHLNNNVDFEGNNFGERERGDNNDEGDHLFEGDFMDNAENLLRHLDRHNENHIIDQNLQLEDEEGVIVEDVFEYQENFEGNENDGINPGALIAIDNLSFPNTPEGDDNSVETNYLLDSIAKTLSLNSQENLYKDDDHESCSFQVLQEDLNSFDCCVPSTSAYSQSPGESDGHFWEAKYRKSEKYITRMLYFPTRCERHCDPPIGGLMCCDNIKHDDLNEFVSNPKEIFYENSESPGDEMNKLLTDDISSRQLDDDTPSLPNNIFDDINRSLRNEDETNDELSIMETVSTQRNRVAFDLEGISTERGGAGDGMGVHLRPSTQSLGHTSMTSNSSSSNDARMDLSERSTISSEDMPIFLPGRVPIREYETSSSNLSFISDPLVNNSNHLMNDLLNDLPLLEGGVENDHMSTFSSDDIGMNSSLNSFSLHVMVSDTSGNDADIEMDSDFEN